MATTQEIVKIAKDDLSKEINNLSLKIFSTLEIEALKGINDYLYGDLYKTEMQTFREGLVDSTYKYFLQDYVGLNIKEIKFANFRKMFKDFIYKELEIDLDEVYKFCCMDYIEELDPTLEKRTLKEKFELIDERVSFSFKTFEEELKQYIRKCYTFIDFDIYLKYGVFKKLGLQILY